MNGKHDIATAGNFNYGYKTSANIGGHGISLSDPSYKERI